MSERCECDCEWLSSLSGPEQTNHLSKVQPASHPMTARTGFSQKVAEHHSRSSQPSVTLLLLLIIVVLLQYWVTIWFWHYSYIWLYKWFKTLLLIVIIWMFFKGILCNILRLREKRECCTPLFVEAVLFPWNGYHHHHSVSFLDFWLN